MTPIGNIQKGVKQNAVFYLIAILLALVLKQHYSQASAEDLDWILKPIAGLVTLVSGDKFSFEPGTGYVCNARRVIIAPACAGVNFMLMAFGMAVFTGMHHMQRHSHRFIWLIYSLMMSYGLTLGVNTLRIIISIYTFHADIFDDGLTWGWIHRLEGVVIYLFFQYLFYSMIRKIIRRYTLKKPSLKPVFRVVRSKRGIEIRKAIVTGLVPCGWYLAVTLAIPFLNSAHRKIGDQFYDHAAMVLSLCLMTFICIVAATLCGQGARLLFTGGYRKHETQNPDN